MYRVHSITACILVFCFAAPAISEPEDWLYEVTVPIQARTQTEATEALDKSFQILLIRLTGFTDIPRSTLLIDAERNINVYLSQFEFQSLNSVHYEESDALVARFNRNSVRDLLRRAQLPIWMSDRPNIVLWLTQVGDDHDSVLQDSDEISSLLHQRAEERGVGLVLPLMDVHDLKLVRSSSVNGRFWVDIAEASSRYANDCIVAATILDDALGRPWIHATTWYQGEEKFNTELVEDFSQVPLQTLDLVVDQIARDYSIDRTQEAVYRIGFSEVRSVQTYGTILKSLNSYDFIDRHEVVSFHDGFIVFDVHTPTSQDLFLQLMSEQKVTPTDVVGKLGSNEVIQSYLWVNEP